MDYARLGKTGLEVSRICFGCMSFGTNKVERPWVLDLDEARPIYRKAWEAGVNFFDTANVYAAGTSEEITGIVLKELAPRDEIVLATKLNFPMRQGPNSRGLNRKAILTEIDHSLQRLQVDYVDLYQIHRHDPFTPYEETMEALDEVVKSGKARYIGASSMWAWQFAKYQLAAERMGTTKFVSMQDQVSLTYREEEREMLPLCKADGIGVIPWAPLNAGKLTRPWGTQTKRTQTDRFQQHLYDDATNKPVVDGLEQTAKTRGVPMAQVALAWVLQKPEITAPIVGVTKIGQLDDAFAALSIKLTPEEITALESPYKPIKVAGF